MFDYLQSPLAQTMLWVGVLVALISVAFYGVRKLRERIGEDQGSASEMLSNFREMHQQGGLSDKEFRTIKTALGTKLQGKSKDSSNKG